jgi:catechol 2,3-dioxygenase-like lactoylglutathione lyase family enzyme
MRPTGIMMVTVQVANFTAAVNWYRDVLGLAVVYLEPDEFCMLAPPDSADSPAPVLALATDHPDRISPRPGMGWAPTLVVDDFDGTVAELRERDVTFDAEEEGADEGYRLVRILDPEGNAIGITA